MKAFTESFEFEEGGSVVVQFCENDDGKVSCVISLDLATECEAQIATVPIPPGVGRLIASMGIQGVELQTEKRACKCEEQSLVINAESLTVAHKKVSDLIATLQYIAIVLKQYPQGKSLGELAFVQTHEA